MFKFVEDNVKGAGTKRKQSAGPCDSCKRRHKRCPHNERPKALSPPGSSPESPRDRPIHNLKQPARSPTGTDSAAKSNTTSTAESTVSPALGQQQSSSSDDAHIRFVANLSPESAFIINASQPVGDGKISRHCVGLWLGQRPEDGAKETRGPGEEEEETVDTQGDILQSSGGRAMLMSNLRPALRRECLAMIPPDHELNMLSNLFYSKIDPIFPILRDEPWEKHNSMEAIALKQCICLVASLDPSMQRHLRLQHTDHVLPQTEFRARIAAAVKQSLDLGFITDEFVLLQVCTLMSMYVAKQGFGELSTYYCAQAVLHEQTLGFHVGWPDGRAGRERSRRLFWCVWVLDRFNAATNGRPTLIHRRDVDSKVLDSVEDQPPPFKLLIRIAQFLENTISLYRPHTLMQDQSENGKDSFEDLVEASGAQNLSNGLLASLELFYLSVVIIRGNSIAHRPNSELQWFCAARIVAIASGEYAPSLVFWPILPYSVTVAASVAYRSLRNSPMAYSRRRAYKLFQEGCEVLGELSKAFLSARAMAEMARGTVLEVERVAAERTRRDSLRVLESTRASSTDDGAAEKGPHGSQESAQATAAAGPPHQSQNPIGLPQSLDMGVAHMATAALPTPGDDDLDVNFFNGFDGDAGIFGSFDPSFDLGRIDAIFSANLDPSAPPFMDRWSGPVDFSWNQPGAV